MTREEDTRRYWQAHLFPHLRVDERREVRRGRPRAVGEVDEDRRLLRRGEVVDAVVLVRVALPGQPRVRVVERAEAAPLARHRELRVARRRRVARRIWVAVHVERVARAQRVRGAARVRVDEPAARERAEPLL